MQFCLLPFGALLLFAGGLVGCSDDPSENGGACVPGATQTCYCTSGDLGAQSCRADGLGWAACNCAEADAPCIPDCVGRQCGPDGCGGSCGDCDATRVCRGGNCICEPDCAGRQCGDDGCGDSCGECEVGSVCDGGKCVCAPDCTDKECGDDGCGGSCGECDAIGEACEEGSCVCAPFCQARECGSDGCGGSCGDCRSGFECQSGKCISLWYEDSWFGLFWENPPSNQKMNLQAALEYCQNLKLGDKIEWHLPYPEELRKLIRGCSNTEFGGACLLHEWNKTDCWPSECEKGKGPEDGCYWPDGVTGPCGIYWSQAHYVSELWVVVFYDASIGTISETTSEIFVRCVSYGK